MLQPGLLPGSRGRLWSRLLDRRFGDVCPSVGRQETHEQFSILYYLRPSLVSFFNALGSEPQVYFVGWRFLREVNRPRSEIEDQPFGDSVPSAILVRFEVNTVAGLL